MLSGRPSKSGLAGNPPRPFSGRSSSAFCGQGKQIMTRDSWHNDSAMGFNSPFAHAEIQFMCLDPNDPQLQRPNVRFKTAPSVVIERDD
jgi:hypothetical protein